MYKDISPELPVVQKYGGTSVATPEKIKDVAARIARQKRAGLKRLAVVVSARSGITNRLVRLVEETNKDCSAKFYDLALAAGEQVSVALMAAALEAEGVAGEAFLAYQLGIMTDSLHAKARIQSIRTDRVEKAWDQGKVAIIAGFQGMTPDMEITTLGRGGSDTSAVAVAVALKAGFCEINTDVDGVFSTDPRIVKEARLIENLDYDVALEMASLGSKVLHPRCVELGAKYEMPLVVRNTFRPDDHLRTRIMPASSNAIEALVVDGVTLDRDIARITLSGLQKDSTLISEVFEKMAEESINVDIIIQNKPEMDPTMRIGFSVEGPELEKAKKGIDALVAEKKYEGVVVETEKALAKVSVVGVGMRSHSGVAARTFTALTSKGIEIHMISTSEIKISCVMDEKNADKAVQTLHDEFIN